MARFAPRAVVGHLAGQSSGRAGCQTGRFHRSRKLRVAKGSLGSTHATNQWRWNAAILARMPRTRGMPGVTVLPKVIESEGHWVISCRWRGKQPRSGNRFVSQKGAKFISKKRRLELRRDGLTKTLEKDMMPGFVAGLDPHEVR